MGDDIVEISHNSLSTGHVSCGRLVYATTLRACFVSQPHSTRLHLWRRESSGIEMCYTPVVKISTAKAVADEALEPTKQQQ